MGGHVRVAERAADTSPMARSPATVVGGTLLTVGVLISTWDFRYGGVFVVGVALTVAGGATLLFARRYR